MRIDGRDPSHGSASSRRAWALWGLVAVPHLLLVGRLNFLCDDAFISFCYARNLADGLGLRFNPGSNPPVEGFSNLLWVTVLAPFEAFGLGAPVTSRVISVAAGLLLLGLLARLLFVQMRLPLRAAVCGLAWTGLMPAFAAWSTGGLETMPFALLVFLTYERLLGDAGRPRPFAAGLAGIGAVLMRVDGFVWILATAVVAFVLGLKRGQQALRRSAVALAGIAALGFGAVEVFRLVYFGDLVPNTVHAKIGFGLSQLKRGGFYLTRFFTVYPAVLLVAAAVPFVVRRRGCPTLSGAAALAAATFAYAFGVGGDWLAGFRFLVPALPWIGVLLAAAAAELASLGARGRRLAVGLVAANFLGLALVTFGIEPARHLARRVMAAEMGPPLSQLAAVDKQHEAARSLVRLGRALARHTEPGRTIVSRFVGAVGYHSRLRVLDQHGLVNREVARSGLERLADATPGHDLFANVGFFEHLEPDYANAAIVSRATLEAAGSEYCEWIFLRWDDEPMMAVYRPVLVPLDDAGDEARYLVLAERDPVRQGGRERWCEPLLRPENLRLPAR
jgi:hypothetical protein